MEITNQGEQRWTHAVLNYVPVTNLVPHTTDKLTNKVLVLDQEKEEARPLDQHESGSISEDTFLMWPLMELLTPRWSKKVTKETDE